MPCRTFRAVSNPATDLANLFDQWATDTGRRTAVVSRHPSGHSSMDLALWRRVADAFRMIDQIEQLLDARESTGRNVAHYRDLLPALYERVVLPNNVWTQEYSGGHGRLGDDDRNRLLGMADILEDIQGATGAHIATVQLKLLQARDLLKGMRRTDVASMHLLWQIEQALKLIGDIGRHDPAYVAEVIEEVVRQGAALDADLEQDETVTPEERSTLRVLLRDITVGMTSSALVSGFMLGAPEVLKALGG